MRKYFRLELLEKITCEAEGRAGRISKWFLKKYGRGRRLYGCVARYSQWCPLSSNNELIESIRGRLFLHCLSVGKFINNNCKSLLLVDQMHLIIQNLEVKIYVV